MFSKFRTKPAPQEPQAAPEAQDFGAEDTAAEPQETPRAQERPRAEAPSRTGAGTLSANLQMSGMKPSVISEGFAITGDIVAEGGLHVEGTIRGQVKVKAATIGPRGQVEGTLECGSLQIKGRFSGTAICHDLFVAATAVVEGRIFYQEITAQRGASIQGTLILGTRSTEPA